MARVTDTREKLLQAALQLVWEEGVGSASVDDICEKAGVRKGSFYHFFKSKGELIIAALEDHFEGARVEFDRIFSPSLPAVERLRGFFEFMVRRQEMKRQQVGRVLGCPYMSIGVSCSSEEQVIREHVEKIFAVYRKYFETALRDGKADGSIPVKEIPVVVETVFQFIEGAMAAGRIQNSLKPIENMGRAAFTLLGLEWEPKTSGARA
ncbi:MAG TPA: TetR/AcrR family transcriptional regulator [Planctomycetota bacterium]|jgi:TetR/AcrR family transcriptional repressor of nem operon|nr:TetR/AcrR family transcriptional regulator [Planctomycetota bacterium]